MSLSSKPDARRVGEDIRFAHLQFGATRVLMNSPKQLSVALSTDDINPICPGHTLVVPRRPVARHGDLPLEEVVDFWCTVQQTLLFLETHQGATAYNIAVTDGFDAGQPVPHLHAHLVPRWREDDLGDDKVHEAIETWSPEAVGRAKPTFDAPADEDRKPRTQEMMAEEAARYRPAMLENGGFSISEAIKFAKFDIHASSIFFVSASNLTVGFVNLKPLMPGHVLLVPRRVVARMADLSGEEVADLFRSLHFVLPIVCAQNGANSANIGIQDGVDAGQSVPHVHVHIIPRRAAAL